MISFWWIIPAAIAGAFIGIFLIAIINSNDDER